MLTDQQLLAAFPADMHAVRVPLGWRAWARNIEAAVLRAQADARPVATVMRNQVLCWLPGAPKLIEGTDLFTHPEASAPGLSDPAFWISAVDAEFLRTVDQASARITAMRKGGGTRVPVFLTRASAATVGEASSFRTSVEAMVRMLEEGEWAEHVATTTGKGDPLAQRLETAITSLINEASHD